MPRIAASSALAHLRIVDLTRVRAGPSCVRQFADFGADVIRIESPPGVDANENMGGARSGSDFQNLQRNKRAMTLNLKQPAAREVFSRLAKSADVVVENYRPDVKFRLGLDYDVAGGDQPAHHPRQHLRLRPGRALPRSAGLRPDRAGHERTDVDHRRCRGRARCGSARRSPTSRRACSPRSAS